MAHDGPTKAVMRRDKGKNETKSTFEDPLKPGALKLDHKSSDHK